MRPRRWGLLAVLAAALLCLAGMGGRLWGYLASVSNYPLATYWSESGRIFAAAQVYSPSVLGVSLSWPWLDPGRAVLDGLILLIPNGEIWMFRAWVALLSVVMTALAAALLIRLARRSAAGTAGAGGGRVIRVLVGCWGFLFLMQGPVYYHMLLGALIVLWLFEADKPRRTLLAVAAASAWEGLCRVNWFLLPAALAVTLHLLLVPFGGRKPTTYLKWPLVWALAGLAASAISYGLFVGLTGYPIPFYDPDMHYGFFRFKLWPNEGFGLGLVAGIALVSAPILGLFALSAWRHPWRLHGIRLVGLVLILGVFWAGSTVVSLRAGGGFDLHNFDTFILLLLAAGVLWGAGAVALDAGPRPLPRPLLENPWVLVGLLLVPVFFAVSSVRGRASPPEERARAAIQQVESLLRSADARQGPVLMIYGRHLLVYGMITGVDVFLPYEKIELMEMAMANNRPYLEGYRADLRDQRFSYILSGMMVQHAQELEHPFGYENNAWGGYVAAPVLEYYQLVYFDEVGLAIYAPK
jgi:hypothetical protein